MRHDMEWQKDYNTGITSIDEQHQKLCHMTSKLDAAMDSDEVNQMMGQILKELVEYVKFHFTDEEKIMKNLSFPDLERHKKLHKDLVTQVANILVDIKNGKDISALELVVFLQKWLIGHIVGEDKKIGDYFYR